MAWIEYHTALRDHWKIKRLATALGVDYTSALGIISCLWLWCVDYSPTGDLRKFTDEEIRFASRDPSSKVTKEVLNTCGLLTEGQFINDWGKHGLKLLESKRKANREYMRRKRDSGYPQDTQRVAIPNHTIPNHNKKEINKEKREKFIPPTNQEVISEFTKINASNPSDLAEGFIAYYESNGWKVGKNKMKSWKAACVNWNRNDKERRGINAPKRESKPFPKDVV